MLTAKRFLIDRIRATAGLLCYWVEVIPAERREWIPELAGNAQTRNVNDIVGELIEVNRMVSNALSGGPAPAHHPMVAPRPFSDVSDALPMFMDSLEVALAELEKIPDESIEESVEVGVRTMRYIDMLEIVYRNCCYHAGQINLIQLQYGDAVFHLPGA